MKLLSTQEAVTPSSFNCGIHTTYTSIVLHCIVNILNLLNCLWLKGRSYYVIYFSFWWREAALTLFHGFLSQKLRTPWNHCCFSGSKNWAFLVANAAKNWVLVNQNFTHGLQQATYIATAYYNAQRKRFKIKIWDIRQVYR